MSAKYNDLEEILDASIEIICRLIVLFKDGAQPQDAMQILDWVYRDEDFKQLLMKAYDNAKDVSVELKEMNVLDYFALASKMSNQTVKIIKALEAKG